MQTAGDFETGINRARPPGSWQKFIRPQEPEALADVIGIDFRRHKELVAEDRRRFGDEAWYASMDAQWNTKNRKGPKERT